MNEGRCQASQRFGGYGTYLTFICTLDQGHADPHRDEWWHHEWVYTQPPSQASAPKQSTRMASRTSVDN